MAFEKSEAFYLGIVAPLLSLINYTLNLTNDTLDKVNTNRRGLS